MRWFSKLSRTPIGIDIGVRQIKAAQLQRSHSGWRVEALSVIPREVSKRDTSRLEPRTNSNSGIDSEEVRLLDSVLQRQGFRGRDVVLAAPRDKILTGTLELPPRGSGAPLDQIARMELSRMHKVSPNSFEMSYWHLPASTKPKDSTYVIAVGCTHADTNEIIDVFEGEGLNVEALDVRTPAALRACKAALTTEPAVTAILDIGWCSACLSLVCRDVIIYERDLNNAGMRFLSEAISAKLQLDDEATGLLLTEVGLAASDENDGTANQSFEEIRTVLARHFDAMVDDLQAPFSYAAHQYSEVGVKRLLLIGGGASISGLAEHLASSLQMEVSTVTPADVAECLPSLLAQSDNAALTLAVGLAKFGGDFA